VTAVTLDAYGTLFDLDAMMVPACRCLLDEQGIAADACALQRVWTERFFLLLELAESDGTPFRTVRELTHEALVAAFAELGLDGDVPRGVECWFEHVRRAPLYPEAREAVRLLAGRCRLAVVSDADDDVLMPAWEAAGLPVELVFTSERSRSYKISPEGRVFREAFAGLGVEPHEVVHVGDSRSDVVGARRAGATPLWLARDGRPWQHGGAPPMVARDLDEAAGIIGPGLPTA
jgi:2-haloalkanoic acid dehalogenase type II